MESARRNRRPLGVTIVAVLTLLSSAVLFLVFAAGCLGGRAYGCRIEVLLSNPYTLFLVLSACGFFLYYAMLYLRTKYVRYTSIVFWIALLAFFVWSYTVSGGWHYMFYMEGGILLMSLPLVYAAGCMIYFMSRAPRQYFSSPPQKRLYGES